MRGPSCKGQGYAVGDKENTQMAEGCLFKCSNCSFELEVWSDGNPFYIDLATMKKVYCYHPEEPKFPLAGNDVPHLCLDCGREFKVECSAIAFDGVHGVRGPETDEYDRVESNDDQKRCTKRACKSTNIIDCQELGGKTCPKCKKGRFTLDPNFYRIS